MIVTDLTYSLAKLQKTCNQKYTKYKTTKNKNNMKTIRSRSIVNAAGGCLTTTSDIPYFVTVFYLPIFSYIQLLQSYQYSLYIFL